MIAGKKCVVCGYGDVGKGCAQAFQGAGRHGVYHRDRSDLRPAGVRWKATRWSRMDDACKWGDIFVTTTGNVDVITRGTWIR